MVIALIANGFCIGTLAAKPVNIFIKYHHVRSLSKKLSDSDCRALIKDGNYKLNRTKAVNFKVSQHRFVRHSYTVINRKEGKNHVLIKLGEGHVTLPQGKLVVKRISYVRDYADGHGTGVLVLEHLCRADFTSSMQASN